MYACVCKLERAGDITSAQPHPHRIDDENESKGRTLLSSSKPPLYGPSDLKNQDCASADCQQDLSCVTDDWEEDDQDSGDGLVSAGKSVMMLIVDNIICSGRGAKSSSPLLDLPGHCSRFDHPRFFALKLLSATSFRVHVNRVSHRRSRGYSGVGRHCCTLHQASAGNRARGRHTLTIPGTG